MFPKHDHLRIEKFVERDAPRAFGSPQGRAEPDKPRAVVPAARCVVLLHGLVLSLAQPRVNVATSLREELKGVAVIENRESGRDQRAGLRHKKNKVVRFAPNF